LVILFKKKNNLIILLLAFLLTFLSLTIYKNRLIEFSKKEIISFFGYQDYGFSNRWNYVDGDLFDDYSSIKFLKKFFLNINKILDYKLNSNHFEKINLDISFKNYKTILNDKINASKNHGLLFNPKFVNGKIFFRGKYYAAKIRLKGASSHFDSSRQMSLRVHLKNGQTILGFNKFSLHKIEERQYPSDYLFQNIFQKSGFLTNNHNFIKVSLNGVNWGVMNMEEHISVNLIEKQKKKESLIIKLSNDERLVYKLNSKSNYINNNRISDPNLFFSIYDGDKQLKDLLKRQKFSYISEKLSKGEAYNILDLESYFNSLILSTIWGNYHTLLDINRRFYFNPYNFKLETITTDQDYFHRINNLQDIKHKEPFFRDNADLIADIFNNHAEIFSKKNYLNKLELYEKIISEEFTNHNIFPLDGKRNPDLLLNNIKYLKKNYNSFINFIKQDYFKYEINSEKPNKDAVSFLDQHIFFKHFDNGLIEIFNLIDDDIFLEEIIFNNKSLVLNKKLSGFLKQDNSKFIFQSNIFGLQDKKIQISTSYKGNKRISTNGYSLISDGIFNPLEELENNANLPSFIEIDSKGNFFIPSGNYLIDDMTVLNGDLNIQSNTVISFSDRAGLIIKGNLKAQGTKQFPIIFKPIDKNYWRGIYVMSNYGNSYIENCFFSNIKNMHDGILNLTGAITFYSSNVEIRDISIDNIIAEDAINIIHSKYLVENSIITNTDSDAIDFDFSDGLSNEIIFKNINGDALDYSGSKSEVKNIFFENIGDKSISIGEKSDLEIKNIKISKSRIGIASKDGSKANISNIKLNDISDFGLMNYIKKPMYGEAQLIAKDITINEPNKLFINQKNNVMIIDGEIIDGQELNVEELYANQ